MPPHNVPTEYRRGMAKETTQEQGRRGARTAQRWLEASTFLVLPWNSYAHEPQCEALCLDGTVKGFDLAGYFFKDSRPVLVEVKHVTSDDHLQDKFHEFLAVAYSSTAKRLEPGPSGKPIRPDDRREFMWVSWHPFNPMSRWAHLESPDEIREALRKNPHLIPDHEISEDLLRLVASRVWVLTFNPKQEKLSLRAGELRKVHQALKRKAGHL